jgi:hypothetical protein
LLEYLFLSKVLEGVVFSGLPLFSSDDIFSPCVFGGAYFFIRGLFKPLLFLGCLFFIGCLFEPPVFLEVPFFV